MPGIHPGDEINTFEQLEEGLREWRSFGDPEIYDVGGMLVLLRACIDNLREYALPAELEDLCPYFTEEQKQFVKAVASWTDAPQAE